MRNVVQNPKSESKGIYLVCSVNIAMAIVMIVGFASPSQAEGEINSTSLRSKFEREYPSAANKLIESLKKIKGFGKYLHTLDEFNKSKKQISSMNWVEFKFYKSGDSLRLDRTFPSRAVPGGPHATNMAIVDSPEMSFSVRNPNTPKANLGIFSTSGTPVGEVRVDLEMFWRDFGHATYWWAERPLTDWLADSGFRIRDVVPEGDDSHLVKILFEYDGRAFFTNKDNVPKSYSCEGFWILDPANDWAIRETWYKDQYKYKLKKEDLLEGREERVTVSLQKTRAGIAPRHVELVSLRPNGKAASNFPYDELYRKIFEFEEVNPEDSPSAVFTPQALGVKDPRRISSSLLLINVAVVFLLTGIVLYWRAHQRSKAKNET